jgi:CarD family transcriptional regulator
MYNIGDLIVYGSTGVCRITDITSRDVPRADENQLYYVLEPIYQDRCIIYTPTNAKVFMRLVISKEEAENLIDMIPSIQVKTYHIRAIGELEEHYKKALKTYEPADLIELTMSIYAKRQEVVEQKRKLGSIDERFMKQAEELLFGELAVALDIPRDSVHDYIERRMNAEHS